MYALEVWSIGLEPTHAFLLYTGYTITSFHGTPTRSQTYDLMLFRPLQTSRVRKFSSPRYSIQEPSREVLSGCDGAIREAGDL